MEICPVVDRSERDFRADCEGCSGAPSRSSWEDDDLTGFFDDRHLFRREEKGVYGTVFGPSARQSAEESTRIFYKSELAFEVSIISLVAHRYLSG
jgi:hypothetical protein